ncbi:hypothetical protein F2Q69_00041284 [Brassica cretica]|uniref:Uncharacterized protein n=1 Tax=Brassica cretica TaxID=69181 RepID=A0A8S9NQ39_BRACR|nr:hypothetical protein F2Q69_00041284 [Brassica cretica]
MEPCQNGDKVIQNGLTEVRPSDRTDQIDRAVYRIEPRTSRMELRLEPRPDDRTDRTTYVLSRPIRQAKTDGRARITFDRVESDNDHNFSLLVRLVRTTYPDDRTDGLASMFDSLVDFSHSDFTKARTSSCLKT